MSPAAPEATNRASTTPRRDGVARLAGGGGEVATATGRTPRRSMQTRRRLPDAGRTRQATVHSPAAGWDGPGAASLNRGPRTGPGTVRAPAPSHRADTDIGRVGMRLRRAAVGVALAAMVVAAGCSGDGSDDSAAGGASEAQVAPADAAAGGQDQAALAAKAGANDAAAPAGKGGAGQGAAEIRLVDLGNRIVRTANVDLEVGQGELNKVVNQATDVVVRAKGIYVGSSTAVPAGQPASGQVTFRVPVDAFEPVLRQLKGLGTYRGEESSTDDVTTQYVDLTGQLTAWRAPARVYLRLLGRARTVTDVIAGPSQLDGVQSNRARLEGQLKHLQDQSSSSTIILRLTEPGAGGPAA